METELSIHKKGELAAVLAEHDLADVIKPLTREIHLFDTYVAGTSHLSDPAVLDTISIGDRLLLRREDNKFDDNAILILDQEQRKLGYVPERDNIIFARLMDAGKMLQAQITRISRKGSFTQINVGIYLIDF